MFVRISSMVLEPYKSTVANLVYENPNIFKNKNHKEAEPDVVKIIRENSLKKGVIPLELEVMLGGVWRDIQKACENIQKAGGRYIPKPWGEVVISEIKIRYKSSAQNTAKLFAGYAVKKGKPYEFENIIADLGEYLLTIPQGKLEIHGIQVPHPLGTATGVVEVKLHDWRDVKTNFKGDEAERFVAGLLGIDKKAVEKTREWMEEKNEELEREYEKILSRYPEIESELKEMMSYVKQGNRVFVL